MSIVKNTTSHTQRSSRRKNSKTKTIKPRKERLFALDIGTRSVIGIVAEKESDGSLRIIATDRREHKTRAMLDGQIHDVPQVAAIIDEVKSSLVKKTGPIKSAAVAAAGRALYTMTAEAEMDTNGVIRLKNNAILILLAFKQLKRHSRNLMLSMTQHYTIALAIALSAICSMAIS